MTAADAEIAIEMGSDACNYVCVCMQEYLDIHVYVLLFTYMYITTCNHYDIVSIGAAGILVSNHGARQLDGAPATVCDACICA